MPTGEVQIVIADGGSANVVLPVESLQLVIGTCSAGTAAQIVPTNNPNTLITSFGYGPLVEAAALVCAAGGTVLAMKAATNAAGTATAVQFVGTGTSVITVTGAPYDDYYVQFLVVAGGTIGTAGITFKVSLDAGRNFGPTIALGTASTYAIPNTGMVLNFAAGTLVASDSAKFKTTAPAWADAGVQACLLAYQASQYPAAGGVGSIHVVGVCAGADETVFGGYLETLATGYIYEGVITTLRDAAAPIAWTGSSAEAESVWMSSIALDTSAVAQRRVLASAGHYNMPSAFANPVAGTPAYRRPGSWALAARQVGIPPQRHAGRVRGLGPLPQIVIDPVNDPKDGFIYHDERVTPGLDAARLCSFQTRIGLPGLFVRNPNLLSPPGSQFVIWPHRAVMDVACEIVNQTAEQEINDDLRLNANGTIYENDALALQGSISGQLQAQMVAANMCSAASVTVDQSWNVANTSIVKIVVAIRGKGYALEVDVLIGYEQPGQAVGG